MRTVADRDLLLVIISTADDLPGVPASTTLIWKIAGF